MSAESIKKGTSEMLILRLLDEEDMYGYQIVQEINKRSEGMFTLKEGSLYPVLYRLIEDGLVSDRMEIVGKRLRKYYHIETKGKERLKEIRQEYNNIIAGINKILGT
jgi:PadR family transcriptional regulator PadR